MTVLQCLNLAMGNVPWAMYWRFLHTERGVLVLVELDA